MSSQILLSPLAPEYVYILYVHVCAHDVHVCACVCVFLCVFVCFVIDRISTVHTDTIIKKGSNTFLLNLATAVFYGSEPLYTQLAMVSFLFGKLGTGNIDHYMY